MTWHKCYNASFSDCNKALRAKTEPLSRSVAKSRGTPVWQTQASRERTRTHATSTAGGQPEPSGKDYAEAASVTTMRARCAVYDMDANVVSAPITSITMNSANAEV